MDLAGYFNNMFDGAKNDVMNVLEVSKDKV